MGCEQWREVLSAQLDGEVTPAERVAADAHLDGCAGCRGLVRPGGGGDQTVPPDRLCRPADRSLTLASPAPTVATDVAAPGRPAPTRRRVLAGSPRRSGTGSCSPCAPGWG